MRFLELTLLAIVGGLAPGAVAHPVLSELAISQPRGGAGLIPRAMLPGQTGGDKKPISESGKKGHITPTASLNPQPLPPGKRHYYSRHHRHPTHPNAITVKQT